MPAPQPKDEIGDVEDRLAAIHALVSNEIRHLLHATADQTDAAINLALGRIGQFCAVDRSYVFRLNAQGTLDNTHEWVAPGVEPMIEHLQNLPCGLIHYWMEDLTSQRVVYIPDVAGLPEDRPEKATLMEQSIQSLVVVPMQFDDRFIGFAGFDAVNLRTSFDPGELYLLRAFADVTGSIMLRREAEQAAADARASLDLSTERQIAMFQAVPELVVELDADGRCLRAHAVNPNFYERAQTKLVGRSIEDVLPADTAAECRNLMREISEKGRINGLLYKVAEADGPRWYELSGSICPPERAGARPGYLMVVRDVSARVSSEGELRRLGKIVEIMTNLVIVVDESSQIVWANPAFERQAGYALAEVVGKRLADVVHGPASNTNTVKEVRAAMAAGQSFSGENVNYDRHGNPYNVRYDMHPLRDADGTKLGYVSVETVTTQQKALERSLQGERDFLTALMDTGVAAVIAFDVQGVPIFANAEAGRLLNCEAANLQGMAQTIALAKVDPTPDGSAARTETPVDTVRRTGRPVRDARCTIVDADGNNRYLSVNAAAVSGTVTNAHVVCAFTDITDLVLAQEALCRSNAKAQHQADHDDTTGLANRRHFDRILRASIDEAKATGEHLAVIMLDLDNFKSINDTFGHAAGDAVLVWVADRLREHAAPALTLARTGGDEFLCLLRAADSDTARQQAATIRNAVNLPILVDSLSVYTTASLGISVFPDDAEDAETLVKHADQAMYAAKQAGRNRHEFFTSEQNTMAVRRSEVLQALRHSLSRDDFRLVFQPKFSLGPGQELVGTEALLRWTSPQLGDVGPSEFIPVAEASGLIVDIDFCVMLMFAMQLGKWVEQGYLLSASLNLSPQTFENPDLADSLIRLLAYHRIPARLVTIEITEGSLISMTEKATENINRLHAAGISLSVDDFGTGHSSFSYLQRLTVDEVKIDRSFVQGIGVERDRHGSEAIIRAILAMARSMGITTVAEGVETLTQMAWLRAEGCDSVQGFKSGAPQDPVTFEKTHLARNLSVRDQKSRWA